MDKLIVDMILSTVLGTEYPNKKAFLGIGILVPYKYLYRTGADIRANRFLSYSPFTMTTNLQKISSVAPTRRRLLGHGMYWALVSCTGILLVPQYIGTHKAVLTD